MLEIMLFGSFEVRRDGQSLCSHWIRHSNRLLALLTLNHNRAIGTDWIRSALLLSETVLPQSLKELYSVLGDDDRHRIRHVNRQIYFDTSGITVDVFEFERWVAKNTPESLVRAIEMHRGGLLKDWVEESWFSEERETYLTDYLDAINILTKAAIGAGDYDRAASYLRRYVSAYPEMDSAWGRLIEVYGLAGNPSKAESAYKCYLESLEKRSTEEERSLPPSSYVLRAYEQAMQCLPVSQVTHHALHSSPFPSEVSASAAAGAPIVMEPVGGAVPLDSPYYLSRPADDLAFEAVARKDSFVLIKGARQVGKSSLLARLLHRARESGAQVVRSDWQKLPHAALETDRTFLRELAETFVDHLELNANPEAHFGTGRAGTTSFERFLKRDVFPTISGSLVWIIDEADRLFDQPYRDDLFAMLRSWHGERATDFTGRWQKLTVILAYATEAYLFISNLDQSPFNVGMRLELDDFTRDQVSEMNRRYGVPLRNKSEVERIYALLGGHPYLVRRCLQEMRIHGLYIADVERSVEQGDGLFKDHLGRMRLALQRDPKMEIALRMYLNSGNTPDYDLFIRLRAAGVMRGNAPLEMRPRCRLYDLYLRRVFA